MAPKFPNFRGIILLNLVQVDTMFDERDYANRRMNGLIWQDHDALFIGYIQICKNEEKN